MSYTPLELNGKVAWSSAALPASTRYRSRLGDAGLMSFPLLVAQNKSRWRQLKLKSAAGAHFGCLRMFLKRESLQRVLHETVKALGKVDILVNSAGRTKRAPTLDFSKTTGTTLWKLSDRHLARVSGFRASHVGTRVMDGSLHRLRSLPLWRSTKLPHTAPARQQSPPLPSRSQ